MCIFGIMSAVSFVSNIFHYKYKKQVEAASASTYTSPSGNHNAANTDSQTISYDNAQNTSQNDTRKLIGYFEHLKGCLDAFSLLWLFFGCAWVFSCKTCQTTAPFLYYSSVSWILYGYVMICIPLLFFSVVVCVVPTAFLIVKHVRQQRLQREAKKVLKTIPLMTYSVVYEERYGLRNGSDNGSSSTIDSSIDCCSICLGGFKWKEKVRRLDCKHYFHQNCGDKWLVAHATCPLCLQSINAVWYFLFLFNKPIQIWSTPRWNLLKTSKWEMTVKSHFIIKSWRHMIFQSPIYC